MKELLLYLRKKVYKKLPKIVYRYDIIDEVIYKYKIVPFDLFRIIEGDFEIEYINMKNIDDKFNILFFVEDIVELEEVYNRYEVFKTKKEVKNNIKDEESN